MSAIGICMYNYCYMLVAVNILYFFFVYVMSVYFTVKWYY